MTEIIAGGQTEAHLEPLLHDELAKIGKLFIRGLRGGGYIDWTTGAMPETLSLKVAGYATIESSLVAVHSHKGLVETKEGCIYEAPLEDKYVMTRSWQIDEDDFKSVPTALARLRFDKTEEAQILQDQSSLFDQLQLGTLEGPLGPYSDHRLAERAYKEKTRNNRRRLDDLWRHRRDEPAVPGPVTEQLSIASEFKYILNRALAAQQAAGEEQAEQY